MSVVNESLSQSAFRNVNFIGLAIPFFVKSVIALRVPLLGPFSRNLGQLPRTISSGKPAALASWKDVVVPNHSCTSGRR